MAHIKNFNEFINEQHVNEYWGADDDMADAYYKKQKEKAYKKFEAWAKMNKGTRTYNDLPVDKLGFKVDTEKIGKYTYRWFYLEKDDEWYLQTNDPSVEIIITDEDGFIRIWSENMNNTIFEDLYTDR